MNDRELLEAAAKAIGLRRDVYRPDKDEPYMFSDEVDGYEWAPLTWDGDALRLAIELRMRISPGRAESYDGQIVRSIFAEQDIYAATRRAIVSVAAEMGARGQGLSSDEGENHAG